MLIELIKNHDVDVFYVGQQGSFDTIIHTVLKELVSEYLHISYAIALERIPQKHSEFDIRDFPDTMYRIRSSTPCHQLEKQMDAQTIGIHCILHHTLLRRICKVCFNGEISEENSH